MAKKDEYRITHPSLYLRVNGKLQEIKVGTIVTGETGERLEAAGMAELVSDAVELEGTGKRRGRPSKEEGGDPVSTEDGE